MALLSSENCWKIAGAGNIYFLATGNYESIPFYICGVIGGVAFLIDVFQCRRQNARISSSDKSKTKAETIGTRTCVSCGEPKAGIFCRSCGTRQTLSP